MIKFILAYDENNYELGYFFKKCAEDLKESLEEEIHQLALELSSHKLTSTYLELKMEIYSDTRFIFTAYSHGSEDRLSSSETYLSTNSNLKPFQDSLFYTFSCLSGLKLGNKLIENNCLAFVGYKAEAYIVTRNEDIFKEGANFGLKKFLQGENIESSINQMKNKYSELIDNTFSEFPIVASMLRRNRDGLILLGNGNLLASDLMN